MAISDEAIYTYGEMSPLFRRPLLGLAALLLASLACANGPQLYRAPSSQWTTRVESALSASPSQLDKTMTSIAGMDPSARNLALGPVVYELGRTLHLDFRKFDALTPVERASALSLAAEAAQTTLTQRSYEMIAQSKNMVWSSEALDRDGLKKLYDVATGLQEIRGRYGVFLDQDARESVEGAALQAASRYRDARASYVKNFGEQIVQGLRDRRGPSVAPEGRPVVKFQPSTAARKMLEDMKVNKSGWGQKDMETVYLGHGFTFRDDGKHRVYYHPVFKQLSTAVSRQNDLPPGYARTAIKLIAELEALSAPAAEPALAAASAATFSLDEPLPPPPVPAAKPKPAPKKAVEAVRLPAEQPLAVATAVEEKAAVEKAVEEKPAEEKVVPPVEPEAQPAPKRTLWDRLLRRP